MISEDYCYGCFGSDFSQILMEFAQIWIKIKLIIRRPSIRIIWTLLYGYQMPTNRPDSPDFGHQILSGYHSLSTSKWDSLHNIFLSNQINFLFLCKTNRISWFWRLLSNFPLAECAAVGDRRRVLRAGETQHWGGRVAVVDDRPDGRRRGGVQVRLDST